MATLHSIADGNLSSAATWAVVDATSYLDSRATSVGLGTVYVQSATFTPGAITISGVSIQLQSRINVPSGTMTVQLYNVTTAAVITSVVVNISDIPNTGGISSAAYIGWTYFKFAVNQLLVAGNGYAIRAFTSVSSQMSVWRDATVNNISRALITTTTSAPAASDVLIAGGSYSSAGVNATTTVTMDSVSLATQYSHLYIGGKGIFNYGIAASTNYALKLAGDIYIGQDGTFTIGTASNPIPATSTAVLEINCASSLQYQIYNWGTLETKYATTVLHRALLNADIAIGAVTSTTDVSTGWKINDVIVIPSTTRTPSQVDRVTLTANAVGTTLTHGATTYAHDGNATIYMQADLVNLTRSIKIRSTSGTFKTRFRQGINGVTTFFDVEFFEMSTFNHVSGSSVYAGTFNTQQCTFWQTTSPATTTLFSFLQTITYTMSNNVFYSYLDIFGYVTDNNVIVGFGGFGAMGSGTLGSNNAITSCTNAGIVSTLPTNGSTGNKFYATSGNGAIYLLPNTSAATYSNYVFFNNQYIVRYATSSSVTGSDRTGFEKWENCYFYGNIISFLEGVTLGASTLTKRMWFNNCYFWGGKTGLITAIGVSALPNDYTHFTNCTFGRRPDGVDSFFSTSCLRGGQHGTTLTNCLFYGTQLSFASINTFSTVNGFQGMVSLKHNGVVNDHRLIQGNGYAQPDSVITYNGTNTIRITPQIATNKTFSNPVRVAVLSGQTCNITMAIRKSVIGDGTAYNGNQPRLMYAFNPLAGNLTETVGVSATVASNGAWEILTYTTPAVSNDCVLEFYIDCDGTTGWINIDDFKTTTANDTRGMNYWSTVGVYSEPDWRKPGGSYGFVN